MRENSEEQDLLLYVLTTRGSLSWDSFKTIFDRLIEGMQLGLATDSEHQLVRWRTAKVIDALCHADISTGPGGAASISPAILARLPLAGDPEAILVGARTARTINDVMTVGRELSCHCEVQPQAVTLHFAPRRIAVRAEEEAGLLRLAAELGVPYEQNPPAWQLACMSSSTTGIQEDGTWTAADVEPNWICRYFDPHRLGFYRQESGLQHPCRLAKYVRPITNQTLYWLWRDGKRLVVDPEWGRYLVLQRIGRNVLFYDRRSLVLAVPVGAPLPRLLARAVTLCSGYAPAFLPGSIGTEKDLRRFDVYRWVPASIAKLVAEKLGQQLQMHDVSIPTEKPV